MEELVRRGHAESCRDGNAGGEVELSHLVAAVVRSKRFSFLTNRGLASKENINWLQKVWWI